MREIYSRRGSNLPQGGSQMVKELKKAVAKVKSILKALVKLLNDFTDLLDLLG
jgi:hypothetical protein